MMSIKNNFDGVRLGLALIVLFAHIGALVQLPEFRWFERVFDSNFAVKGFFAISGYLVTKSYLSSASLWDYVAKRIRRIWPAYVTVVFLCYVLGSWLSTLTLSDYFLSASATKYFFSNLFFLNFLQPTLPEVFIDNPMQAVNGALWTIKVEVMLYGCIPFLVFLWKRNGALLYAIGLMILSALWVNYFSYHFSGSHGEEIARQFPGQLSYFAAGSFLSINDRCRAYVKYAGPASVVFLLFSADPAVNTMVAPIAYTSIVIWLSTFNAKVFDFGKHGDLSYGIYLVHFPIIQALIALEIFDKAPWVGVVLVLVLTICCAWISWRFIERNTLRRSSHYIQVEGA